jgi:hypothetical protein
VELGSWIGRKTAFEVPPPGSGLTTVIKAVLGRAMSEERIKAISREPFTKAVVRGLPFQFTFDPGTNPVPLTTSVNVNPGTPAGAIASGTRGWLTKGTGFCAVTISVDQTNKATTLKMRTRIVNSRVMG